MPWDNDELSGLTTKATSDTIYVTRLPYCNAKGCQKRRPHPQRRKKYPVPAFRSATLTSRAVDRGVKTLYTTESAIPLNHVYLRRKSAICLTWSRDLLARHEANVIREYASKGKPLPPRCPVQGVFGVGRRCWDQDDILVAPRMTSCNVVVEVDQLNRTWHLGLVDIGEGMGPKVLR